MKKIAFMFFMALTLNSYGEYIFLPADKYHILKSSDPVLDERIRIKREKEVESLGNLLFRMPFEDKKAFYQSLKICQGKILSFNAEYLDKYHPLKEEIEYIKGVLVDNDTDNKSYNCGDYNPVESVFKYLEEDQAIEFIDSIQVGDGFVKGGKNLMFLKKLPQEEAINLIKAITGYRDTKALCLPWDENGCRFTKCRVDDDGERCLSSSSDGYCGLDCGRMR